mmetsp:Transcript_17568/g.29655  ORF Transcript_17568/g.29655 Transcript_17568/m.29655 type:complete len:157 (-) Transcript_17568:60-530(-)
MAAVAALGVLSNIKIGIGKHDENHNINSNKNHSSNIDRQQHTTDHQSSDTNIDKSNYHKGNIVHGNSRKFGNLHSYGGTTCIGDTCEGLMNLGLFGASTGTYRPYDMNGLPVRSHPVHQGMIPLMDLKLQRQNAFYGNAPTLMMLEAPASSEVYFL